MFLKCKNGLRLLALFSSISSMAEVEITRLVATIAPATRPVIGQNTQSEYLVLSQKEVARNRLEYAVLGVGKVNAYTVAKISKVQAVVRNGVFQSVSGKLPDGKSFDVRNLEAQQGTQEEKPAGTLLSRYCGANEEAGALEDARVLSICIQSGKAALVP